MSGLFDQITNYSPPLLTAGQVNYKGTWSAAANSPTLTSPPPATSKGDYYVVSAAGTQFGITFAVGDWIISNGTAWEKVDLTDSVSSVFGRTGAVVSANGDYTASQVTNVPAGTISSTNVQDAINELSADIATAQNVLDAYVTNDEAIAITKGQVVYAFGATGNRMSVKLANNSADATSAKTVGVVLDSSIAAGNPGYIRMVGVVDGLNLGAYNDGDTLYLGATAGSVTSTKPYAPNHLVYVGIVERANNGNGQLYVRVQNGYELDEIHDVQITSAPASGALLVRDATNSLWKAARLTAGTNIAITNADASVTVGITGAIAGTNGGTGVNNGANTITIAGNVTHAGAFTQTFTATANTALTLPVTGTLATLAGSEALSNKTITASAFNGTVGATTPSTGRFTTVRLDNTDVLTWGGAYGAGIPSILGSTGAGELQFRPTGSTNGTVATLTSTGLNSTAIGATTPSTGAFTTLSASGTISHLLSANSGVTGFSSQNSNAGTSAYLLSSLNNGTNLLNSYILGVNWSGTFLTGGPATQSAGIYTSANIPISIGINNAEVARFTSTGLAVTGALSSTTGATFATSSGNVGIGVTPQTQFSTVKALSIQGTNGSGGQISSGGSQDIIISGNAYLDASAVWQRNATGAAAQMRITNGITSWLNTTGTTGAITFTQAMTLDASGRLAIGTTSIDEMVRINGSSNATSRIRIQNQTSDIAFLGSALGISGSGNANDLMLSSASTNNLVFGTNTTERARIDSSGNLLVGTTTASASPATGVQLCNTSGTLGGVFIGHDTGTATGNYYATFNYASGLIGSITQSGTSAVLYNVTSDYRRKSNVKDLTGSGTFIDALKPRTFDWDTGDKGVGFIAHEFAEVSPTSVCGEKDAVDADGNPKYQAMQASSAEVIANLVAELKSLRQRVAALESSN